MCLVQLATSRGCRFLSSFMALDSKAGILAGCESNIVETSGGQVGSYVS